MRILTILAALAITMGTATCAKGVENKAGDKTTATTELSSNQKNTVKKMKPTELTVDIFKKKVMDFEKNPQNWVFEGDKPAIIDFYATWCGPCRATAPILEEIATEYDGKVDVYKVDVDQQQQLAMLFGVQSIPSLLFIPKDGKPQMSVGAMGKADFKKAIADVLKVE